MLRTWISLQVNGVKKERKFSIVIGWLFQFCFQLWQSGFHWITTERVVEENGTFWFFDSDSINLVTLWFLIFTTVGQKSSYNSDSSLNSRCLWIHHNNFFKNLSLTTILGWHKKSHHCNETHPVRNIKNMGLGWPNLTPWPRSRK